jgi:pyruvate dehydrogenase E1 component alpha subunit/2-oxoisovalerate dehydrogenase E1 component
LPVAVGLALADKMLNRPLVTCCFFGEGAAAEGEFHESLNLAALWRLPVLFVCENNLYAMGTALARSQALTDIARKASAYTIESEAVDGMDLQAVTNAAVKAVTVIREKGGPYFLECRTYRFRAHSMFDPELYRSKSEVEAWKKHDPIPAFTAALKGLISEGDIEAIENDVAAEIEDAVQFAESGTLEPVSSLERFVYSERRTA